MVNIIWLILLAGGIAFGAANGNLDNVSIAIFQSAKQGIGIALELAGTMALWMGLLKLAEASGLVKVIAYLAAPIIKRLFPQIPADHPAFGAMIMNISANLLGLGNAATPFGLKAMEHLQTLNDDKEKATASMITFLALNTSCLTFLPAMVISLRVQAGSTAPGEIIGPTFIATLCGVSAALFLDWFFRHYAQRKGI